MLVAFCIFVVVAASMKYRLKSLFLSDMSKYSYKSRIRPCEIWTLTWCFTRCKNYLQVTLVAYGSRVTIQSSHCWLLSAHVWLQLWGKQGSFPTRGFKTDRQSVRWLTRSPARAPRVGSTLWFLKARQTNLTSGCFVCFGINSNGFQLFIQSSEGKDFLTLKNRL